MKTLLERRIAARQRIVELVGKQITLRRPTEYEKAKYYRLPPIEYVCQFVDDCPLTEADLFDGGNAETPVPFDRALFADWLAEKPDLWKPLVDALGELNAQHEAARAEALKNSNPGLSAPTCQD